MSCKEEQFKPINEQTQFKRDSILAMMKAKEWIPEMESCWELDLCIKKAEKDLVDERVTFNSLEEFVYHIDWIFVCEWDTCVRDWYNLMAELSEGDDD